LIWFQCENSIGSNRRLVQLENAPSPEWCTTSLLSKQTGSKHRFCSFFCFYLKKILSGIGKQIHARFTRGSKTYSSGLYYAHLVLLTRPILGHVIAFNYEGGNFGRNNPPNGSFTYAIWVDHG
jgi:hypothetical protein